MGMFDRTILRILDRALRVGLAVAIIVPTSAAAQGAVDPEHGIVAVGRSLRGLGSVKRVLLIGAHPDDEDTALLTWLERGIGADAAYLSLNRGEGGQNLIGSELGVELGLIRTGELLAARELDGAEQFFTRAYDYGYSKSAEEAFRFWSRDSLLADVVATIRRFRPQVVVSIFSGTQRDGHGQHQAAGILAREAFVVAADPARFPEQSEWGLAPWQPLKLYRSTRFDRDATTLAIETGEFDPLYGRSYHQIAMAGRSQHRSQDMGRIEALGPRRTRLQLLESRVRTDEDTGLFSGVDTSFSGALGAVLGGALEGNLAAAVEAYEGRLDRARDAFRVWRQERLEEELSFALAALDGIAEGLRARAAEPHAEFLLRQERAHLENALAEAAGIVVAAFTSDDLIVPGQALMVEVELWNGGDRALAIDGIELVMPVGWSSESTTAIPNTLAPDTLVETRFRVDVSRKARPSHPYFLERPLSGAMYSWPDDPTVRGLAFGPPPVRVRVHMRVAGRALSRDIDAVYRYADQARGEVRRPVDVVPALGVGVQPEVSIQPLDRDWPLDVSVKLRAESPDGISGSLWLRAPKGWGVMPPEAEFDFKGPGSERLHRFRVTPAPNVAAGTYVLRAEAEDGRGRLYDIGYTMIDYPHIRRALLFHEPLMRVEAFELAVDSTLRVGLIPGVGGAVADAIESMGMQVDILSDRTIRMEDLSSYDVLVLGIRAYETNAALVAANDRVLEWVQRGGTLIVQYQQYAFFREGYAPYRMTARFPHDRVSDEQAEIRMLDPEHPVFTRPNRIEPADFEGWIQERGLYFPGEWDERYTPLIETADPGEAAKRGALLVAEYGDGLYVYTGLSLFRQLPVGVPGAYRLLANLLNLGR